MHALKTMTDEVVSQKDIDKVMKKLEAARDDEPDDFGFVSSDYKKPEIVESSDSEEETEFVEEEMSAYQLAIRDDILDQLVETGKVDTKSKAFQTLRYSDQLGILDEIRDSFKFDRSYLTGHINSIKKEENSQKSQEEQDKEFSKYQLDGLLSKNNIRKEIRKVEDESKKNNLRDIIENSQGKLRKAGKKYALFDHEDIEPKEKIAKSIFDLEDKKIDQKGTLSESSSEDEFVSDDSEYDVTTEEEIKVPASQKHGILGLETSVGEIESSSTSDIVDIEIPESILMLARLAAQKRDKAATMEADFKKKILESSDSSDVQYVHDDKVRKAETLNGGDATPQMPLCALRQYLDKSDDFVDVTDRNRISEVNESTSFKEFESFDHENDNQHQVKTNSKPTEDITDDSNSVQTTTDYAKLEEFVNEDKKEHPEILEKCNDEIKEENLQKSSVFPINPLVQEKQIFLSDKKTEIKAENIKNRDDFPINTSLVSEKHEFLSEDEPEMNVEPLSPYLNEFAKEVWEVLIMEMAEEQVEYAIEKVKFEKLQESEVLDESWSSFIRETITDIALLSLDKELQKKKSSAAVSDQIAEFTAASVLEENAVQLQKLSSALKITSVPSQQLYKDAAEMLTLFGCGVFFAPGEAEAQCAEFEMTNITQGTITDDGDTFLFGGRTVIKGLTLGNMVPVKYDIQETEFSREFLIALAQLTGSDYCNGIKSVGSKTAIKILEEFDDRRSEDPHLTLNTFSKWWNTHHKSLTTGTNGIPLRAKLKKLNIDADFPSDRSRHAYLHPNVEKLKDKKIRFTVPDLNRIRQYAARKLEWQEEAIDQHIIPLLPEKMEKRKDIRFYMKAK
ncbi:unnamed protein product [Oikopleura dioica]|uniref:XPG-I domain-containing protein n=1 Tax=Oikopleura dioica TaxID=34765 RepID=E4YI47_OIKDI|nr:unnamed protein product [Oikopleura dioica]